MSNKDLTPEMRQAIGMPVHNPDGEVIGEIQDVIVREDDVLAILDLSEGLHTDEASAYAVAWESLDTKHEEGLRMSIELNQDVLEQAQDLESMDRRKYDDAAWRGAVFLYHAQAHLAS